MEIGLRFQGKYKIKKRLGAGGMGSVYLAENTNLENSYWAIKQIRKVNSSIDAKTEQKILTQLNHPSIIKIVDVTDDRENIYLIEEFVDGCTIFEALVKSKDKVIEEDVAIQWAKQVADALIYLHSRQPHPIIHRDLKLSNIMLDSNGRIKIIDFGIAKNYVEGESLVEDKIGTDLYAAPEQILKGYSDNRADIYSLGIVLYFLVTGFNKKLDKKNIKPIREINPNLSIGLENIIKKCVEENPENRYKNVKELLHDLNNVHKFDSKYKALVRKKYITTAVSIALLGGFVVLTKSGINQLAVEKLERYNGKIESGQQMVLSGNYEVALDNFEEAINIIPKNPEGYKSIAKMYYQIGEYENCINYLEKEALLQMTILHEDADCLYILGSAYFKNEDYVMAIKRFEKAAKLNPDAVNYLRDLAVSYAKNEQIDKAKEALGKLENKSAQEDVTSYVKGEILLKEKDIKSAVESFELSLELGNNDEIKSKSIIALAETYRDYKDQLGSDAIDNEIAVLEKAEGILQDKNNLVITEMLAKAYYDKAVASNSREHYEKSIISFENLLSLGYKRPYIYRNIAIIYQQQLGDYAMAEETLMKMKEVFPQEISCYIQLSLLNIEIENNKAEKDRDYSTAYDYYIQAVNYDTAGSNSSLKQLESLINELRSKGWLN